MGENSKIEWTHHTFNPWRGCTKVSPGCANCYAETQAKRSPGVLGVWGPHGSRVVASESMWREPLRWDREAKAAGERRRVFCASMADVFEDWHGPVFGTRAAQLFSDRHGGWSPQYSDRDGHRLLLTLDDVRERLLFLIRDTPNLDWLLLTKRPENIVATYARLDLHDPIGQLPNIWLGTSVENQAAADDRIPHLLDAPAKVRFLSCEPLLGPVSLAPAWNHGNFDPDFDARIDWVIAGGESGPNARPMHPDWARSLRDQCVAAGVAFHFKQWGEWADAFSCVSGEWMCSHWPNGAISARVGKKLAGRELDGREWNEFPAVKGGVQ